MQRLPSFRPNRIVLVVLAVLLIAAVAIILSTLISPTDTPSPSAIVGLPTSNPIDLQRNATKAAQTLQEEQQAAGARQTPAPSLTDVARKQPRPPSRPGAVAEPAMFKPIPGGVPTGPGAIVQVQPPFSNNQYHIENTWYIDSIGATRRTFVFVGNMAGPGGQITDQGVVVVQAMQYVVVDGAPSVKTLETKAYTSTISSGSLHVTGADSNRLILQTSAGVTVQFDLTSRTFRTP
jgi:hypothetical protein